MQKTPIKQQLETLLKYYQTEDYKKAEELAIILTNNFPKDELVWKILSVSLKKVIAEDL